jgi:2-polyprenyl-3-methyl-5-hydroxy-6-metoxy-1,4-benzoquinol methylase
MTHREGARIAPRIQPISERKQAERDYPARLSEPGRAWLRTKPWQNAPRETGRHLVDAGYVLQLLDLKPGMRFVELGCGPGWMTSFAARQGCVATGYDIAPEMIAIARERASNEGVDVTYEVADMEELDLLHEFDACLTYDSLHHSAQPELVLRAAARALKPGGRLLISEPNWKQRLQGRDASETYGTTELGYSPRHLKRLLRDSGFRKIERFHNNRKRLFSNSLTDTIAHLAEPLTYRLLAPMWTQVWLRAETPQGSPASG